MPLKRRYLFLCRFLLISVPKAHGFDVWKIYGEALRIIVHLMDVDAGTKLSITNCVNI